MCYNFLRFLLKFVVVLLQVTLGLLVTEFVARFPSAAAVIFFFGPKINQRKIMYTEINRQFLETKSFSVLYWFFWKVQGKLFKVAFYLDLTFFNVVKIFSKFFYKQCPKNVFLKALFGCMVLIGLHRLNLETIF